MRDRKAKKEDRKRRTIKGLSYRKKERVRE